MLKSRAEKWMVVGQNTDKMELEKKGTEERGEKTFGGFPGPSSECQQDQNLEIYTDDVIRGRSIIDFSLHGRLWDLMFAYTKLH